MTPQKNIMRQFEYKVFDIDEVEIPEKQFIDKMAIDGWKLFFINNEPVDHYPQILIKLYFRRKINYLFKFFRFIWDW
tara:strand:- start:55 stop:285 length:231 start_codon:yes stop_codon:yes gene_type:complete